MQAAEAISVKLETERLYHHGAPNFFGADPEFCNKKLKSFLRAHQIQIRFGPSVSPHKNGKVERNNEIFKSVFEKISRDTTTATNEV